MLLWMVLVLARESHFAKPSIGEGGAKNSRPFTVICPALTFFVEKVLLWIFILLTRLLVKYKLEVMLLLELIFGTEFTNDEAS